MVYDVIIIGAGPAGMSAGIYVCRKKLSALILSKDIGGQAAQSWDVENYLGYQMINGADLVGKFKEHLDSFKCVTFKQGVEVKEIKKYRNKEVKKSDFFEVQTKQGETYQGQTIIIASGKNPRRLNVSGEKEYLAKGVTYCATCDAPIFAGKDVAVIGDGNSALGATYQLAKIAKIVYLLVVGEKFRADLDQALLTNATASPNVKVIFSAQTANISGEKFVSTLEYKDLIGGGLNSLKVQGIFIEIGSEPVVDFCQDLVKLNESNEIIIDKYNMTSVAGIFAAGDVTEVVEKQVIIAAGEGAKAAIGASRYLSVQKN